VYAQQSSAAPQERESRKERTEGKNGIKVNTKTLNCPPLVETAEKRGCGEEEGRKKG